MTGVPAILALIPDGVEQELVAESAEDNLVELQLDELVSVHLVHLVLALADCSLTSDTARSIERPLADVLLDCDDVEVVI